MLKSAIRFWLFATVMCLGFSGCSVIGVTSGTTRPPPIPPPETHEVVVYGTTAPLTYSQDTVVVHPRDIIVWRHASDDVAIQVNLLGVPVTPDSLTIPAGQTRSAVVDTNPVSMVYEYFVTVIGENGVVVDDPYIDVQPGPEAGRN